MPFFQLRNSAVAETGESKVIRTNPSRSVGPPLVSKRTEPLTGTETVKTLFEIEPIVTTNGLPSSA